METINQLKEQARMWQLRAQRLGLTPMPLPEMVSKNYLEWYVDWIKQIILHRICHK